MRGNAYQEPKVRSDSWSHEDDLLLAETVLRHIREGSTQLEAFEEAGDRFGRTGWGRFHPCIQSPVRH